MGINFYLFRSYPLLSYYVIDNMQFIDEIMWILIQTNFGILCSKMSPKYQLKQWLQWKVLNQNIQLDPHSL